MKKKKKEKKRGYGWCRAAGSGNSRESDRETSIDCTTPARDIEKFLVAARFSLFYRMTRRSKSTQHRQSATVLVVANSFLPLPGNIAYYSLPEPNVRDLLIENKLSFRRFATKATDSARLTFVATSSFMMERGTRRFLTTKSAVSG